MTRSLPHVWLLCGHKAGDNNQLLALADALGWPFEIKRMAYRSHELIVGRFGATLAGIDRQHSDPLVSPWPDLILTAGRRNEAVALWIRNQAAREDLLVRLVHVGRPWASLRHFDLVVTSAQYRLPDQPNVLKNSLPLHRLTQQALQKAAEAWRPRIWMPEPYITLNVGGNSGPYQFDDRVAEKLGRQASELARKRGASLLVTTSARTPPASVEALESAIDIPAEIYRWRRNAEYNPYLGFLALAEEIIVTGDSMSMLAEACFTGKPVHIFPFGSGRFAMRPEAPLPPLPRPFWDRQTWRVWRSKLALMLAPSRLTRDVRLIHHALIESGRAVWLGEPFPPPSPPPEDELEQTAARVKRLLPEALAK